jgi:hypothetical protein
VKSCTVHLILCVFALLASADASAAPSLIGEWHARSRVYHGKKIPLARGAKIVVVFKRGGAFITRTTLVHHGKHKTRTEKGTWKVKGRHLTLTTTYRAPDTMIYEVRGKVLTLTKKAQGQRLILRRR